MSLFRKFKVAYVYNNCVFIASSLMMYSKFWVSCFPIPTETKMENCSQVDIKLGYRLGCLATVSMMIM